MSTTIASSLTKLTLSQSTHKLGLAVSIDGAPEELEEIAQRTESASPPY